MKILIVARYFPPLPSGGGRRPYLMAKALAEAGHQVTIASPVANPEFASIPVPHPCPEPPADVLPDRHTLWKADIRAWGRELLRWPDPDSAWAGRLTRAVIAAGLQPDLVITTSPPESVLLAGAALKKHYGCKWIADFRDCWFMPLRRPERGLFFRQWGERLIARYILPKADHVIAVDATVAAEMSTLAPVNAKIVPQLLPAVVEAPPLSPSERVHLVYTGQVSIGDPYRNIDAILVPFVQARQKNPSLCLHFAGHFTHEEREAIAPFLSEGSVVHHGALSFSDVLQLQNGADGLILLSSDNGWAVPGKWFEYKVTGRPVIVIGSGPWRKAAGLHEGGDPVRQMMDLEKFDPTKAFPPPVIEDTGKAGLLALVERL